MPRISSRMLSATCGVARAELAPRGEWERTRAASHLAAMPSTAAVIVEWWVAQDRQTRRAQF